MPPLLSVIIPCLNEAKTVGFCVDKARNYFFEWGISGEVIVVDNGSADDSADLAIAHGARLVTQPRVGYGNALKAGIAAAQGTYAIMGDADDTYNFQDMAPFVHALEVGNELVVGNRFKGEIKPGAMSLMHRFGNFFLSGIGGFLFPSASRDFHCGMRGFQLEAIRSLHLKSEGMEFASEMLIRAYQKKLKIAEVPITLYPSKRDGPSNLKVWRDGWRHLKLLFSSYFQPRLEETSDEVSD